MSKLNDYDIQFLIERLQRDEPIPDDYKYKLFPTKQKEYELVYAGKMRKEDLLANEDGVFPVPLQVEKVFNGKEYSADENEWRNMIVFGDNLQFLKTVYENRDPLIKNKVKGKVKLIYIDPPFGTGDEYDGNKGQSAYSARKKGAEFVEFIRRRIILLREILSEDGLMFVRMDYHFSHYIKLALDEVFGKENFKNELIVNRIKKNVTVKGRRNIPAQTDTLFVYIKTDLSSYVDVSKKISGLKEGYWHAMDSAGVSGPRQTIIKGKTFYPPSGRHFSFTQAQVDEMYEAGRIRINPKSGKPQYWVLPKEEIALDSNWTDIPGYSFTTNYPTENSEDLLKRVIKLTTSRGDLVMDVFAGSGTTMSVSERLGRLWIVCDIGKFAFYTVQKRILTIENSKDLENPKKKYDKKARGFITVNTGLYDLKKIFELKKDEYID